MPKNCTECKFNKDCHSYYGSPVCLNKNNQN